ADSRQVYKGLDIGRGQDISEYTVLKTDDNGTQFTKQIPYHLIDIATLKEEYNVFSYQTDFYRVFDSIRKKNQTAFVVGGTGMYLDAVLRGYDFVPVPENKTLRLELEEKSLEELGQQLLKLKPDLHNKSDLLLRERVVRAIEIELFMKSPECAELRKTLPPRPDIKPLVLGTTLSRPMLHENIKKRLLERIEGGMIDEVEKLHKEGASWERLEKLGLEYRYVSLYLEGKIGSKEEMTELLNHAINQFAKRQETWFRGMERKGCKIHWLPEVPGKAERFEAARKIIEEALSS
ncbi:MAG: tRNA (adenosine(37)-N6)-dimethylallyltransferase MiaA, partial [Treponema sp.]|nr:tRNA (adenosine(37)-N6)-dimethylallyltransferase MiaA [Treponema sp.]